MKLSRSGFNSDRSPGFIQARTARSGRLCTTPSRRDRTLSVDEPIGTIAGEKPDALRENRPLRLLMNPLTYQT